MAMNEYDDAIENTIKAFEEWFLTMLWAGKKGVVDAAELKRTRRNLIDAVLLMSELADRRIQ